MYENGILTCFFHKYGHDFVEFLIRLSDGKRGSAMSLADIRPHMDKEELGEYLDVLEKIALSIKKRDKSLYRKMIRREGVAVSASTGNMR